METVVLSWRVELESWFVSPLETMQDQENWQAFDKWAESQADLAEFRFILSGENYTCRWLTLPGVQARHLSKALPFALEESLIEDISQYHLVTAGKIGKFNHRVYCNLTDAFNRLIDVCELHHIQMRQLIPETSLVNDNCLIHDGEFWLINIPGIAEAKVHESSLAIFLEGMCADLEQGSQASITIIDKNLDGANLLKTQIETNFSDVFTEITVSHGRFISQRDDALNKKCCDLLTAEFRPVEVKQEKPAAWWKPIAVLAACWGLFSFTHTLMENNQLQQQEQLVRGATISLYKQLFPGERVRFLERQIRTKITDGGKISTAGFMLLLNKSSSAYQKVNTNKNIQWQNVKFNDRQKLLVIDLTAKSIAELQQFKSALEEKNLNVEIASATNENNAVKGRIKIGESS